MLARLVAAADETIFAMRPLCKAQYVV